MIRLDDRIGGCSECLHAFLLWKPLSYRQHFLASRLRTRDIAKMATDSTDPAIRAAFDDITCAMSSILTSVAAALRAAEDDDDRARVAAETVACLKPLMLLAGGVVNGAMVADIDHILSH